MSSITHASRRGILATVGVTLLCVLLTACSSSGSTATSTGGGGASSGSSSAAGVAAAQVLVDKWLSKTGTTTEPPVSGGPKATAGKKIVIISCGESSSSCARASAGAQEAAKAIGWQSSVFDTKGDYSTAATGVRQAIAQKADGIFVYFIDCSYMKEPLEEAKAAGIPVVQAEGVDCNVSDPSAPQLFTWSVTYTEGPLLTWIKAWAQAQAAYLIVNGEGKGNSLFVADNEAILTKNQIEAYNAEMATCTGCTSKVVAYSFAQQYAGLGQLVSSELLKNPDLTQVGVAYDGILQAGVSQAVQQAEQTGGKYAVMAGEGQAPTIDLVHSGLVTAGIGLDNGAEAWSAIDALNRIFNKATPVSSGIGIQIYDATHNLPASGPYVSPVDYRATYKAEWGVN